ncbi:MAG: type IV secretory system conjugative DNA transfer family protein [Acidimicrobiales bacterium]
MTARPFVERDPSSEPAGTVGSGHRGATVRSPREAPAAQRSACALRSRGIFLGVGTSGLTWAGREHSTLVLGPSRSGKTTALMIPNVLGAEGAVVSTSTKSDVLHKTLPTRRRMGWCALFDPSGTVEPMPGVHRIGWSPVVAARDWDGAARVARSMVDAARGQRSGAVDSGPDRHWTERAGSLLGPLLHAAALSGEPMRTVVHWVDRHDGSRALSVLEGHYGGIAAPTDLLAGIVSTDSREQSGIWSTASGIVGAYRAEVALASTEPPYLDADAFCAGRNTLYICGDGAYQQLLAPLVVGIVAQVRDAAYRRGGDLREPPVLLALDEVANIAPLPDLPALVTEGPGQGLLTLACLQDLSQARARWGPEANAFLSIFGSSIVLGGIADIPTLEALSALGGEQERVNRSVGRSSGASGRQVSTTDTAELRRRLPVDVIARGAPGWALVVDARNRLGWVRLAPEHRPGPWRADVGLHRDDGIVAARREPYVSRTDRSIEGDPLRAREGWRR